MFKIELVPDMSHCIETVAKREYGEAIKQILTTGEADDELQGKAELLRILLEKVDFSRLRRESEKYLIVGKTVKFAFYLEEGAAKYEMSIV